MQDTSAVLFQELDRLKISFSALSARLIEAAEQFRFSARPLPESIVVDLSEFQRGILDLGSRILDLGEQLSVPADRLIDVAVASPDDLDRLLQIVAAIEKERANAALKERAVAVLNRFLSVVHRDSRTFAPLLECQAAARDLRDQMINSTASELHPAVYEISEGKHPVSKLVQLISHQSDLTDEEWLRLQAAAAVSFKKELVVAAARGKLELAPGNIVAEPKDEAGGRRIQILQQPPFQPELEPQAAPAVVHAVTPDNVSDADLLYEQSLAKIEETLAHGPPDLEKGLRELQELFRDREKQEDPSLAANGFDDLFRMTLEAQKSSPTLKEGIQKAIRAFSKSPSSS